MKHAGGRPPLYDSPEKMQDVIDEYFAECDNRIKEIHTKEGDSVGVNVPEPYTMSGLAYALGMSRQTVIDYKNKDEFLDTIKRARARVERDVERRLMEGTTGAAGPIFNLKNNFSWRDKSEVESSGEITHKFEDMDDEELERAIKARQDKLA